MTTPEPAVDVLVDMHAHFLPATLVAALRRRSEPPRVYDVDGSAVLDYGHGGAERIGDAAGDVDRVLAGMERNGIALTVLSINQPGVIGLPIADAVPIAREANDELVGLIAAHPGRLAGLATLPLQDPDAAVAELERAVGAGLRGAMILPNVEGTSIAEPQFAPLLAAAARLDVALLLHPTMPWGADRFRHDGLIGALGYLFDTTTATTQLVLRGLYDRHPELKLVLCHAGSLLPQLVGRIDLEASRDIVKSTLSVPPSEHFKLLYTDVVCGWAPALTSALSLFREDRIMFGSDFPFWQPEDSLAVTAELAKTQALPAGVASATAAGVFGLQLDGVATPSV